MKVEAVTPHHLDALADLFRACESPCFCRYWHFEGDKNAWLERELVWRAESDLDFAKSVGEIAKDFKVMTEHLTGSR